MSLSSSPRSSRLLPVRCGHKRGLSYARWLAPRQAPEGFDDESGLPPALEPAAERVDILEAAGHQEGGDLRARRLSRLRAVKHDLAVSRDQLMWTPQRFGSDPARLGDSVGRWLDVQRRPQVDDHKVVTSVQPSLELRRHDASLPQMNEEAPPSHVLEHEMADQHRHDDLDNRHPEASGPCCHQTDEIREEIAERDPGSGPEQRPGRGVEQESFGAKGDHAGESGG